MNIFDLLIGGVGAPAGRVLTVGDPNVGINSTVSADSQTVLYTCVKILSDSFSMLPLVVRDKSGKVLTDHELAWLFNHRANSFMNGQGLKSVNEWERNTFGNTFVQKKKDSLLHIPADQFKDWRINPQGVLQYEFMEYVDSRRPPLGFQGWQDAKNFYHFKGVSGNGIVGMSPLSAAHSTHELMSNAIRTVNNFYKNDARVSKVIESSVPVGASYQNVLADRKAFEAQNAGVDNAGKTLKLPLGEKITPLAVKFVDAELIKTMEFTRDTISSLYQIPNWMLSSNDSSQNIEEQTTQFAKSMKVISTPYAEEIAFKGLTEQEVKAGLTVSYDVDVLKEVLFKDKIVALKDAVTNFLMTPNQAAKRLGEPPIIGGWGDYNLGQAQYIPLQEGEKFNPLVKDKPIINNND